MMDSTNIIHPTTQYALDVVSGKIVAGKYVLLACKRHLNDLERAKLEIETFPYTFSEIKADEVFTFAEKHCRHIEDGLTVRKGDPVTFDPFLQFIIGSVFGWVHKHSELRRFRKAYEQVARKNSKSTTLSVVGLKMLAADGEGGPQVYTAGTMRDQAKIVYDASVAMVDQSKVLKAKIKTRRNTMYHKTNGGKMLPLSKETKKMDGFNPHCGIVDEYHAHPTSDMYDVLISGMGMRRQPLMFVISTAGYNLSGPCYAEYVYCKKVLEGIYENDEYFIYIAEMDEDDDINDERNWIKANPLLAQTEAGLKFLRGELKIAQEMPEKRRGVFTKNFNIWLDQKDNGYMPLNKWDACGVNDKVMPDLRGRICYVGIDLSKKIDLTSISFEFVLDDGRYAVYSHSFMPEETLREKTQTDKVPYALWVSQGWITETSGAVTDYRFISAYILKVVEEKGWKIKEICFDPYNATQFASDLQSQGFECIEIRQGVQTLSGPTKDFRDMVYSLRIIHNKNPVLRWAFSNAVIRQDHNENIMLDKDKSTERIDPAAAVMDAHVRASIVNNKKPSIYKTRGATVL